MRRGLRVAGQRGNQKVRHRAHYNLGFALACNGAFYEGLEHLKIAQMLRPSKELPTIIVQVTTYAKEVEQAKRQLKNLGRRPGELEQPPVAEQEVPSIEPWTKDDVPLLSE